MWLVLYFNLRYTLKFDYLLIQLTKYLPLAMKPLWKSHINFLIQIPMQKSIVNIQLTKKPALNGNHNKEYFDRHHFGHRGKGLKIVHTLFLCKTLSN